MTRETREEAKNIMSQMIKDEDGFLSDNIVEAHKMAIKALDYDFAKWVAREIFDDNWEYNKEAFAELACRKLAKLGIVIRMGDEWELVDSEEV